MTRLSDALDRARRTTGDDQTAPRGPAIPAAPRWRDEAPGAWESDFGAPSIHVPEPPPKDEPKPELGPDLELREARPFDHRFSDAMSSMVVVGPQADRALVEQYRRLAAALHQANLRDGTRSVMVASAVTAEGKTLTAINLALTLSHSYQRRVLLIDADLRRPAVHDVFRLPNRVGLDDCLKGLEAGRLPVQKVSPTLWVLTAGRPDPDPMSGLVSDTMKTLLLEATEQFDWVVVDTPPVALLPDANLLAGMLDTALLVVSSSTTPYPVVQRAAESIGVQRILGVVLNRAEKSALADGYGRYGYYYDHSTPAAEPKRPGLGWFRSKKARVS